MSQQFCLKWNNHMNNMMDVFKNLLSTESMVDVTLACDGLSLKAHKMVLSACSPFFQSLFLENPCKHPIVILKDMKYSELKAIIEFMYHGEVNVAQDQLSALMKTAETLRVKGLAEVTNEKNSASNSAQDEPGHRSVPRTETPPPQSKRRRGRVRKRSLSDSNRSDDSNEPKIKQPVSPDIEELSGDITMDNSSGGHFSNLQSQVPMQSLPSHSTNSYHKSSVVSQDPHVEEPASADESEFGVEPAKLLEQTLTTDDLSNRRSGRVSTMSSSMEMQRRPRSSTDHSSIVPTSMPSESMGSNQPPDSPPDIKPELLELEPPMSPVAGPSHSTDNSMMMYMDQSSVSSHPGTSYQDNQALVPQDSQPQGLFYCDKCDRVFTSQGVLNTHKKRHRPDTSEKRHRCSLCPYASHYSSHLRQHSFTHSGERPYKCTQCEAGFTQKSLLRKHMLNHETKESSAKIDNNIGNSKVIGDKKRQDTQSSTVEEASVKSNKTDNEREEDIMMVKREKTSIGDKKRKEDQSSATKVSAKSNKLYQGQREDVGRKESKKIEKVSIGGKKRQQAESSPQCHVLDYENKEDLIEKIDKTLVDCEKQQTDHSSKTAFPKHCERCSKYLIDDKQLQEHLSMHRKKDKPHKCKMCNKRFVTLSSLSRHDRKHHGKKKLSASAKGLKVKIMNEPIKLPLSDIEMSPISDKSTSLQNDDLIADDKKVAATLDELKPSKRQKKKTSINQVSPTNKEIKSSFPKDELCPIEIRARPLSDTKSETSTSNQSETPSDVEIASDTEEQGEGVIDEEDPAETSDELTERSEKSHEKETFIS